VAHLDVSVRRCGMLAAEVIAQFSGKKLDFKDWDGDGPGKPWARAIRTLIQQRDVDSDLNCLESIHYNEPDIAEISQAPGRNSARSIPSELSTGYDSDDSITGYASLPSSRSISPTPLELEEIEKDPTLRVGVTKVPQPVYLTKLGELIRGTGGTNGKNEPHEADKIEVALNCAAELIRKKRDYGTELGKFAISCAPRPS
jgi:telomere length regulation protein